MNDLVVVLNGKTEPLDGDVARRFIVDVARIWEGVLALELVQSRYALSDRAWAKLAEHDALVKSVKEEMHARICSNAVARERSQIAYAKAPAVVENILTSEGEASRNKLEAAKLLRGMASGEGDDRAADRERFVITINLGADGSDHIEVYDKALRPIDQPMIDIPEDKATGTDNG